MVEILKKVALIELQHKIQQNMCRRPCRNLISKHRQRNKESFAFFYPPINHLSTAHQFPQDPRKRGWVVKLRGARTLVN